MKKQATKEMVKWLKDRGVKVYLSDAGRAELEQGGTIVDMMRITRAEEYRKKRR